MRILWIAPYPNRPDQHPAPWIQTLAHELIKAGHELDILTPNSKGKVIETTNTPYGYRLIRLPYSGGLIHLLSLFQSQIRALNKYLRKIHSHYDIIHIHGTELQYASSLNLGFGNHRPSYILSIQGIISLYKKELPFSFSKRTLYWALSSFYERKDIRQATYFFCRTEWDKAFVNRIHPRATIIHCWETIRPEFFSYKPTFLGKDLLFMGGENPLKSLPFCLRVFNEFVKGKPVKLHIVGSARESAIWKKIKFMRLANIQPGNIIFHGMLNASEICALYENCFCLYHPSLIDNSPNSICEAQVSGLPVIATAVGGVPSLIENGQTGILVNKNDPSGHLQALEILYQDNRWQKTLGYQAQKMARQRHDVKEIVDITIQAYQKIIHARNS